MCVSHTVADAGIEDWVYMVYINTHKNQTIIAYYVLNVHQFKANST